MLRPFHRGHGNFKIRGNMSQGLQDRSTKGSKSRKGATLEKNQINIRDAGGRRVGDKHIGAGPAAAAWGSKIGSAKRVDVKAK